MTVLVLRKERRIVAVPSTPTCSHHGHVTHHGQRYGATVHPSGQWASLTPCTHNNKDGQ